MRPFYIATSRFLLALQNSSLNYAAGFLASLASPVSRRIYVDSYICDWIWWCGAECCRRRQVSTVTAASKRPCGHTEMCIQPKSCYRDSVMASGERQKHIRPVAVTVHRAYYSHMCTNTCLSLSLSLSLPHPHISPTLHCVFASLARSTMISMNKFSVNWV